MKNIDQSGWVKIHRKILENPISSKPQYLSVWVHLLLMASHKETSFIWNNQKVALKEGQFITGRKKISLVSGVKESSVEKILKYLELEHQIEQQKTRKYRIITIVKWLDYQKDNIKSNNRVTTEEQQSNTIKNLKNYKNVKKDTSEASSPFEWKRYLQGMHDSQRIDIQLIGYYFERRNLEFSSKQEAEVAIRRHLRGAKEVSVFEKKKVFKAMDECDHLEKQKGIKWSLETVLKYLTK